MLPMVAMLAPTRVRSILIAAFVQALLAELKLCGEIGRGNVHKAIAKTHNRPVISAFGQTGH
jgi:hypothetical protein